MIEIIIKSIMMFISVACIILSYNSANKINKIPHTRREVVQATALETESILFAIVWAVASISLLIVTVL